MLITIQESRPVSPPLSLSPPLPPKILLARREESGEGNDEPGDPAGWYAAKNPYWLQEGQEGKLLGRVTKERSLPAARLRYCIQPCMWCVCAQAGRGWFQTRRIGRGAETAHHCTHRPRSRPCVSRGTDSLRVILASALLSDIGAI